jgi:C4-dicarboxylate transporter DctM subunit
MIAAVFGMLFLMLFIGVPIAISLGISTLFAFFTFGGNATSLIVIPQRMFVQSDQYIFMAVPFFMLAGELMLQGGLSEKLVAFIKRLLWFLPASLACITTAASAFFGAISGSNPATVAAIGGTMAPSMKKDGYPSDVVAAVAASSGTLGVIIPPSIPMITYGMVASVSVAKLFIGGILPGLGLAIIICLTNIWVCRKFGSKPREIRAQMKLENQSLWRLFKQAIWALLMPLIILGGIYGGIFTPTEAGVISALYAFLVGKFVYHTLTFQILKECFLKAGISTALILLVIAFCGPFTWFMTSNKIPEMIASTIISLVSNKYLLIFLINVVLLLLGCFFDAGSIILLITSIFIPIAAAVDISPFSLGIIMIVNTSVGMLTPPMAVNLYVAKQITGASIEQISRKIFPYLITEGIFVIVISYFPGIIEWLPNLIF